MTRVVALTSRLSTILQSTSTQCSRTVVAAPEAYAHIQACTGWNAAPSLARAFAVGNIGTDHPSTSGAPDRGTDSGDPIGAQGTSTPPAGVTGGGDAPRTGSMSSVMGDSGGASPAGAERMPLPDSDAAPRPDDSAPEVAYEDRPGGFGKSQAGN